VVAHYRARVGGDPSAARPGPAWARSSQLTSCATAVTFPTLGHLSDHIGRRKVVVPALLLGIVAAVVMSVWPTLLVAGRVRV
jgi:MFS family permease